MPGVGREIAVCFVKWTLIDSSSPYFNIWECDAGYRESFWKGIDPNISQKYGIDSKYIRNLIKNDDTAVLRMVDSRKGYLKR